jgi:Uncharacterized protein conserved in bacteria
MSYAFEEVQDCVIEMFKRMADYGSDGISMLFNRCFPYILYEGPVAKAFIEKTGKNPVELEENDREWLLFRADFMTGFMRKVRKEMDLYSKKLGRERINISVTTLANGQQNIFFALDAETWVKEGLVDDIIAYPIALVSSNEHSSSKVKVIPIDIDYYKNITNGSNCKLYIDILPRTMEPEEYRQRALEIYSKDVYGITLWDTYNRYPLLRQWSMASRLGHKDELAVWDDGMGKMFRNIPIKKLGSYRVDLYPPQWGL